MTFRFKRHFLAAGLCAFATLAWGGTQDEDPCGILTELQSHHQADRSFSFRQEQRCHLSLKTLAKMVDWLNAHPRLQSLELTHLDLGDQGATILSGAQHLAKVTFRDQGLSDEGLVTLMTLPGLRSLDVSHNAIRGNIPASAVSPTLRSLDLSENELDPQAAIHFLASLPDLDSLVLQKVQLTPDLFQVLVGKKFQRLDLSGNVLGDEAVVSLSATNVRKLFLNEANLSSKGVLQLGFNPYVEELHLSQNQISDLGAQTLAQNRHLRVLDLGYNAIGPLGAKALAQSQNLHWLILTGNNIGDEGAAAFGDNTELVVLSLVDNQIGLRGAKELARNNRLESLQISYNPIGDAGIVALSEGLPYLSQFSASGVALSDRGVYALSKRKPLVYLDLSHNRITDNGAFELVKGHISDPFPFEDEDEESFFPPALFGLEFNQISLSGLRAFHAKPHLVLSAYGNPGWEDFSKEYQPNPDTQDDDLLRELSN